MISSANMPTTEDSRQWILNEASNLLNTDEYAAKSWLLVGKTLFPRCFIIRYEIYSLEKISKNAPETSLYLEELLTTFYQEERVWEEMFSILQAVLSDEGSEDAKFLREVFRRLPRTLQAFVLSDMLRRMSFMLPNIYQQSRLLIHIVDNYPELPDHGASLVDLWSKAEARDKEAVLTPVNHYREELVLNVLPKVLSSSDTIVPSKILTWYITAVEYFVFVAVNEPSHLGRDQLKKNDAPSKDPWDKLRSLGKLVAKKLGWSDDMDTFFDSETSLKAKDQILGEAYKKYLGMTSEEAIVEVESLKLFALFLTLFFQSLHSYITSLDPHLSKNAAGNTIKTSLALVEVSLLDDLNTVEDLRAKKPKLEESFADRSVLPGAATSPSDVVGGFLIAVKLWSILNGGSFAMRVGALQSHWLKKKHWPWMNQFRIDLMIYEGRYEEGLHLCETIKVMKHPSDTPGVRMNEHRSTVQLICCAYRSCSHKAFFKMLLNCLFEDLGDMTLGPTKFPTAPLFPFDQPDPHTFQAHRKEIQLKFLPLSDRAILSYGIQSLIGCFWSLWKSRMVASHSDTIMGHMLVLMQHDVYQNETQMCELVDHIRKQGRFSYHLFTNYISNIAVLEEFIFLQSPAGGHVTLDILPVSIQTAQASRAVTRGVNKDTREEMKVAIERQVLRSNEDVHQLLKNFLRNEAHLLMKEFN